MIRRAPRTESNFYILDKQISEDTRLTWAARGLLIYLLGKKDNWEVSVAHLQKQTDDSVKPTKRDGIYNLLNELISSGYVSRVPSERDGGKFSGMDYLVSEVPCTDLTDAAENTEFEPRPPLPHTAAPLTVTTIQVSNDIKQELNTTKKSDTTGETAKKFTKPTIDQVQDYINDKSYSVNAERFMAYYDANGWVIGRSRMKCWKSALRTWQLNEQQRNGNGTKTSFNPSRKLSLVDEAQAAIDRIEARTRRERVVN